MTTWRATSLALLALFAIIIYEALDLPLLDQLGPGPGFFPLCLSIVGSILAVILFFQSRAMATAEPSPETDDPPSEGGLFRPVAVLVLVAALALALDPPFELPALGFRLTALVFIAALLLALGIRNPISITLFAVIGSFGVFQVFNDWLKVILPVGAWGI